MAVGAPWDDGSAIGVAGDDSAPSGGAVYVFHRDAGSWSQEAYVKHPDSPLRVVPGSVSQGVEHGHGGPARLVRLAQR